MANRTIFLLFIFFVLFYIGCDKDDNPAINNTSTNYEWKLDFQITNFDSSFCNSVFCKGGGEIDSIDLTKADSIKMEFDLRTNGEKNNYYLIKNNYDVKDSIVLEKYNDEKWHSLVLCTKISHKLVTNFYFSYLLDFLNYYCIKNFKFYVKRY